MFCKHCGKQIDEDSQYCKYCGKILESVNNQIINNVVTLKTKEESPIKIEVSKRDCNRRSFWGSFSLKTKTADAIVFFIRNIERFLKDSFVTLLFYFPIYLICSFIFVFFAKISWSNDWFNDYYYYTTEDSDGAVIQVGIIGFLAVLFIKYIIKTIKWAYKNKSIIKN